MITSLISQLSMDTTSISAMADLLDCSSFSSLADLEALLNSPVKKLAALRKLVVVCLYTPVRHNATRRMGTSRVGLADCSEDLKT